MQSPETNDDLPVILTKESKPPVVKSKGCCKKAEPLDNDDGHMKSEEAFHNIDTNLEQLYKTIQNHDTETPTKTFLSEDAVSTYKDTRTNNGVSLARCVYHNAVDKYQLYPRIMDEHCINDFIDFFQPIIDDAQDLSNASFEAVSASRTFNLRKLSDYKSMIIGVDYEVVRNIRGYEMGESLIGKPAITLGNILQDSISATKMGGNFIPVADEAGIESLQQNDVRIAKQSDIVRLLDHFKKFPEGKSVYFGTENSPIRYSQLAIAINVGDHLRISSTNNSVIAATNALKTLFNCLTQIQVYLKYAMSEGGSVSIQDSFKDDGTSGDEINDHYNHIFNEPCSSDAHQGGGGRRSMSQGDCKWKCQRVLEVAVNECNVFATSPGYGFVTYNPKDIGSGFHIRFLVRVPLLKSLPNFEDVIEDLTKNIEVSYPKESADEVSVVYFGNKRTLGMSVVQIINEAIEDIISILKMEKELKNSNPKFNRGIFVVEQSEYLRNKIERGVLCRSYTRKVLNKSIITQYKTTETINGGRLSHCIRGNAYSDSAIFPRACDADAYDQYKTLFEPIIKEYNGIDRIEHLDGDALPQDIENFAHPKILSYRVRIARNFDGIPFAPLMTATDRKIVEMKLKSSLSLLKDEFATSYYPLGDVLSSLINDEGLIMKANSDIARNFGVYHDWPKGRGMFIFPRNPKSTNTVVWVNEEDHVRIISIDRSGENLSNAVYVCQTVMKHFDKFFPHVFAKDSKLGYLTYCPSELGSGLRVSAHVKLDHLQSCSMKNKLKAVCLDNCLQVRGTDGEHSKICDGIFDVSLKARLGLTDSDQIKRFLIGLKHLIDADE